MTENKPVIDDSWSDPDDAPEWTDEHFLHAQVSIGGKVVREAVGTWTKPGRPPTDHPKKQITLRLDPDVIDAFRATGKGWQSRVNKALREKLGLASR